MLPMIGESLSVIIQGENSQGEKDFTHERSLAMDIDFGDIWEPGFKYDFKNKMKC